MSDSTLSPDAERRSRNIRVVQTMGLVIAGAYLILTFGRYGSLGLQVLIPGAGALAAVTAAGLATMRAKLSYYLFLAASFFVLLDLADGYTHALLFLGSFLIFGALCAINEPDDDEVLTIKRLMDED